MSKLNGGSKILCSCSHKRVGFQRVLDEETRRFHDINEMSFCPSCQMAKCKWCFKTDIIKKYCPSCMNDYTSANEIHCTRNCFTCPGCESMLKITPIDVVVDDIGGKKFAFNCTFCSYSYETETILKPKPLLTIIRNESTKSNDAYDTFQSISASYSNMVKYENLKESLMKDLRNGVKYKGVSEDVIRQLRDLKVSVPQNNDFVALDNLKLTIDTSGPVKLDENDDVGVTQTKLTKGPAFNIFGTTNFPIPKRLTTKNSIRCCDCNHTLLMPNEELLSTKFQIKWNANEFLPFISVSAQEGPLHTSIESGKSYNYIISIINPLSRSVNVNLSSPFEYDYNKAHIRTTIPVSKVTIGPLSPKDHIIRGIPTCQLTKETKLSRAELVMRTGRSQSARNHDTSVDFLESLADGNDNWYSVPLEVSITTESESIDKIMIPIFITLTSTLPEPMRALNLSKKDLNVGFWSTTSLGPFKISH